MTIMVFRQSTACAQRHTAQRRSACGVGRSLCHVFDTESVFHAVMLLLKALASENATKDVGS